MVNYIFLATDEKLPSFEEAMADECIKSFNELLELGYKEKNLMIRGIDFSYLDKDGKIFLIELPEELANSPLSIEDDSKNTYARYLTNKKFIYKITGVEKVIEHFLKYIEKCAMIFTELELWQVVEDDYLIELSSIPTEVVNVRQLTMGILEKFFDRKKPKKLVITQS